MGSWQLIIASGFLSASGVAGLLGVAVKWRQVRMTSAATGTSQVIDGLTRLAQEQRAELERKDDQIADLEAQLHRRGRTR